MIFFDPYKKGQSLLIDNNIMKLKSATHKLLNSKSKKTGLSLFHYYIINARDTDLNPHEIISLFLSAGVDINQQSNKEKGFYSALHFAVGFPANFHLTQVLVENGIDINLRDEYGNTAFWNACHDYRGNDEEAKIIEYLYDKGARIDTTNNADISVKDLIDQIGKSIDEGINPSEWDLRKLKINV